MCRRRIVSGTKRRVRPRKMKRGIAEGDLGGYIDALFFALRW
jgi:hypothetical protein